MRILGIDPALRNTGYGIVESSGSGKITVVTFGVIRTGATLAQSACLHKIFTELKALIETYKPEVGAVEGVIYLQNYRTAITLGAARASALLAMTDYGLAIHEYAPRKVKSASTGQGGAQKHQVGFMMRALLGLTENPPPDAADALAVALTHAQSKKGLSQGIVL